MGVDLPARSEFHGSTRYAKDWGWGSAAPGTIGARALERRLAAAALLASAAPLGCAPTVNVLGVYFPGWLVSALAGVSISYTLVWWLACRPATRALADSGVFFCGLAVGVAFGIWWVFFSSF